MPDDNVIRPDFNTKFAKNEELAGEVYEVICKYHNQISLAEVVGVLDIVKAYVINNHFDDEE
jgi:hypothetical protein